MKNLAILLAFGSMLFAGCSNLALKKEWTQRGYTESDIQRIEPFQKNYSSLLGNSTSTQAFGSNVENNENQKRVRTIFCACVKKLGTKCQKKPDGLSGDDLELWSKGNGAEMALRQAHAINNFARFDSQGGAVDTAECM